MSYQEEEKSRLKRQATRQAIDLAMKGSWKEAVAVNRSILEVFPDDVESWNRLGRAYMELGALGEAERAYRRTVQIDPYNAIALKNLQRIERRRAAGAEGGAGVGRLDPKSFIEEVGKAGVVQLVEVAPSEVLARLAPGDNVNLREVGGTLVVESTRGDVLGRVEPRHEARLLKLMAGGNRYSAAIVTVGEGSVSVIVREVYQHPSQRGRPSFPGRAAAGLRLDLSDRVIRRELEQEEVSESGYRVVGAGEEAELVLEDPTEEDLDEGDDI